MVISLHTTLSPVSRGERNKINENWDRIIAGLTKIQQQINVLAGGEELEELIRRLNETVENAHVAVQEAIESNNTATQEAIEENNKALQTALKEVSDAITQLESAITSTNDAAKNANEATVNTKQVIADAKNATQDALKAVTAMQNFVNQLVPKGEYDNEVQYLTNNIATLNGNSYIAKKDTKGNPPPTPPLTSNANWQVLALQGAQGKQGLQGIPGKDGKDGTGVNIIGELMSEDDLEPLTGEPGDAYMINGDLYVWQENSGTWKNVGPIQGPDGKSAYDLAVKNGFKGTMEEWIESLKGPPGPPGPEGPPGPPADLTEINQTVDDLKDEVTEHLAQIDTRLTDLESGASGAKADIVGLTREVAYMKLKQDANDRIEGGTVFADDFNGNRFGFTLDEVNSRGFKIINGKLVLLEDVQLNHSVSDSTVVANSYSTVGNGGRKLIQLNNGWLVTVTLQSNNSITYISKDYGVTWSQFKTNSWSSVQDACLATDGELIYLLFAKQNSDVQLIRYDKDGTVIGGSAIAVDKSQLELGNVSLVVDPTNGHLHAVWASKSSELSRQFNIRYSKSTDKGATWSTVRRLSDTNDNGYRFSTPTIIIRNSVPIILHDFVIGGSHRIIAHILKSDTDRESFYPQPTTSFDQTYPSAIVDREGVILSIWQGVESSGSSLYHIRFSKSVDGGYTWSEVKSLVVGMGGSITVDKNNRYTITYEDNGVVKRIESTDKGDNWSNPTVIGTGKNPSSLCDMSSSIEFTTPPTIYSSTSDVKFTGTWSEHSENRTTKATVVYNIPSTYYVGAFVEKTGALDVSAYLNDVLMKNELEGNEYELDGKIATESPVSMRLELNRADTSGGENDAITRILGGRA